MYFNANGGSLGSVPSTFTYSVTPAWTILPGPCTRTGYVQAGWSKNKNEPYDGDVLTYGTNRQFDSSWNGITFYAIWWKGFRITYNANASNATGAPSSQVADGDTGSLRLSSTEPTRPGYVFAGWATSSSGAVKYQPGETYTFSANTTLYAIWKAELTLTYDANGGSLMSVPATQTFQSGSCTLSSYEPYRLGYKFIGWGTAASSTSSSYAAGSTQTFTASKTIYAIWQGTVTYYANGGSGVPSAQTFIAGKSITLSSTKPTRSGYTFMGWAKSSSASTSQYNAGSLQTFDGNTNLYAVWGAEQYLYFDANGGSGGPSTVTFASGANVTIPTTKPTRTGCTFVGWAESAYATAAQYTAGSSYPLSYTTTLYAVWRVTISFNATSGNGSTTGSGAPAAMNVIVGQAGKIPSTTPTRSGYNFLGWATDSYPKAVEYAIGDSFYPTANMTLYAVWQGTVRYDAMEGSGAPSPTYFICGQQAKLSSGTPTRNGYSFAGWSTSNTVMTPKYQAGDLVSFVVGTATLYAVYTAAPTYTVTIDYQGGTGSPATLSCLQGQSVTLPASPTKQGFKFKGFDTSRTGTGSIGSDTTITPNGNMTLYAIWEEIVELQAPTDLEFIGYQRRLSSNDRGFYPSPVMRCLPAKKIQGDTVETIPPNPGDVLDFYANIAAPMYESGIFPTGTGISGWDTAFSRYNASDRKLYVQGSITDTRRDMLDGTRYTYWLHASIPLSAVRYDTTKWETYELPVPTAYKITFDPNGGTVSEPTKTVDINNPQYEFPTATRSGYVFDGWTLKDMPNPVAWHPRFDEIADVGLYGNLTYVAKWSTQLKVRFRASYVSRDSAVQNMPADMNCTGTSIIIPDKVPELEGYTFTGWSTSRDGDSDERYFPGDRFTPTGGQSIILFAQFVAGVPDITITFDAQGGECATTTAIIPINSALNDIPQPTYAGRRFLGWFTSPSGGTEVDGSTVFKQDTTLYAQWEIVVRRLTFDAGEGHIKGTGKQSAELTIPHGESVESAGLVAPIAELNGQHFAGWYTEDDKRFEVTIRYEEDTAFTARYTDNNLYGCLPIGIDGKPVAVRPYVIKNGKWVRGNEHVYTASKWQITSCPSEYAYVPPEERVAHMPRIDGFAVYTGAKVSPTLVNYFEAEVVLTGDTSGIAVGSYILRATPKPGYVWEDGSRVTRDIPWAILASAPATKLGAKDVPVQINIPEYTGSPITPSFQYDNTKMTISVSPATNAGEYEAMITAAEDYEWEDDMT